MRKSAFSPSEAKRDCQVVCVFVCGSMCQSPGPQVVILRDGTRGDHKYWNYYLWKALRRCWVSSS